MVRRIIRTQLAGLLLSFSLVASARATTFVTLGFDDNTADQKIALALLNARGLKATFYVNTGFVGTSGFYMNQADLNAVAAAGHEVAGHSLTHRDLTTLSAAQLAGDVCGDRARLVEWGFAPVSFAYPYGTYNAAVQNAVRDCGYRNARSVGELQCAGCPAAESVPPGDAYGIRSLPLVLRETSLARLQQQVMAAENSGSGWVSFIFHRVCDGCGTDSITQADLTAFLDWLRPREARETFVRTTAQVMETRNPSVSGLSPGSWPAGGSAFNLTVDGENFSAGASVRFNGATRPGVLQGTTRLIVYIPPGDIAAPGTASVTVENPGPEGGASNALPFAVTGGTAGGGAALSAAALGPASWPAGGSAFNLTVDGTGFAAGAVVRFNGMNRPGVLQGTTRLIVYIPSSDVVAPGTATVVAANPDGVVSNALSFLVTGAGPAANPVPAIGALDPPTRPAGGGAFSLGVLGAGFVPGAVVRFNGADRPTAFISGTALGAALGAGDVAFAGSFGIAVVNPPPGGGASNELAFGVSASASGSPTLTALYPASWPSGGTAFNLTVDGTGFSPGSVVRFNGVNRPGVLQGTTRLIVYIPPSDVAAAQTASVTVAVPGADGGVSNALSFAVTGEGVENNPVPSLAAVSPSSRTAGDPAFTLSVQGSGFVPGATLRFNGADRATTFLSTASVRASILAADIAAAQTASIGVFNPGPGGGLSGTLAYPVHPAGGAVVNPVPTIHAVSPLSWPAGGSAFNLTVDGRDFVAGAVVRFNDANRPGVLRGSTRLIVYIPPSDAIAPGTAAIRVFNPGPGGGTSNALTFTVSPPGSAPAGLTPAAADPAFSFHQAYAFPNPSRRGQPVTLRLQTGIADAVHLRIFDVSGAPVHHGTAGPPILLDDGNGLGPQYTYDYVWNAARAGSGIYVYRLAAEKAGEREIRKVGKIGVIK